MAKKHLKIAFYSPYLTHHLGGGEKHLLDVARVCAMNGNEVSICLPMEMGKTRVKALQQKLFATFGISPDLFSWIPSPLFKPSFSWKKLQWTSQFDVVYFVTDGSLFFSRARLNVLHVQIPFTQPLRGFINKCKLRNWQVIQTNSAFTKKVIERSWNCHVNEVLYPLVDEQLFNNQGKKEKIILSVGRFFRQLHSKRQDILVEAFRKLLAKTPESKGWRLVLLGSVEDEEYFADVRRAAHGLAIEFVTNAGRKDVLRWFKQATLYWHGTGFQQDEMKNPEKVEHFGISTVESMASGAVPLAVGKGGQKEILSGQLTDLQWQTMDELVTKTSILLRSPDYLKKFQALSQARARDFDEKHFEAAVLQLFKQEKA